MGVTVEELEAKGFVATEYEGQEGVFYVKKCLLGKMPSARTLVDNCFITKDMVAITETIPEGDVTLSMIQFHVPDADYLDGPFPLESDEGRVLLQDAIDTRPAPEEN